MRKVIWFFGSMRYLDFSTPTSDMRSVFFEFSSLCGGREGEMEVAIMIVLLSAGEGRVKIASRGISCKCSV